MGRAFQWAEHVTYVCICTGWHQYCKSHLLWTVFLKTSLLLEREQSSFLVFIRWSDYIALNFSLLIKQCEWLMNEVI